jgi:hypothetical protein
MMNPEIKAMWVSALRSSNYKQGHGSLRNTGNEYCCLGVLCDLMPNADGKWYIVEVHYRSIYEFAGRSDILPDSVMMWANLESPDPKINLGRGEYVELSTLNDMRKYTFKEIANVIEASSL